MTTECCKFCGAGWSTIPFCTDSFWCGTRRDYTYRDLECRAVTCDRYESIFQIPPWSTDPITAEVCERLGMTKNDELSWYIEDFWCCVRYYEDVKRWEVAIEGGYQRWCKTAGQLALLIAASKGAVK